MKLSTLTGLAILLCAPVAAQIGASKQKDPEPIAVSFEDGAVVASRVTPGGEVYFASVSVYGDGFRTIIEKPAGIVVDSDSDGVARFEPDGDAVRPRGYWLIVDVTEGTYVVASRSWKRELDFPERAIKNNPKGALARIGIMRSDIDLVVARPGEGLWIGNSKDGSGTDADKKFDGLSSIDLEQFVPVGDSPSPPGHFRAGDIVMIVDPNMGEFLVSTHGSKSDK